MCSSLVTRMCLLLNLSHISNLRQCFTQDMGCGKWGGGRGLGAEGGSGEVAASVQS